MTAIIEQLFLSLLLAMPTIIIIILLLKLIIWSLGSFDKKIL